MSLKYPALKKILDISPSTNGKKVAIFGLQNCLWWSSYPEDAGKSEAGLSCCPYCKSPLGEMPLDQFLHNAEHEPVRYGPDGLKTFVKAHHRSKYGTCRTRWDRYKVKID